MKVSTKVSYGIRFMLSLSLQSERGFIRLSEIAEKEQISEKYLENIVTSIKTLGVLDVKRGSRGGYRLAKQPSQIRLIDLFEVLDNTFLDFNNLPDSESAQIVSNLVIKNVWGGLKVTMQEYLSNTTLANLAEESLKISNG